MTTLRADLDTEREALLAEGLGDHFYGAWRGGAKGSGGRPDGGGSAPLDRNHHPGGQVGVDVSAAAAKYRDRTFESKGSTATSPAEIRALRAKREAEARGEKPPSSDPTRKALHEYLQSNPRTAAERSGPPDSRVGADQRSAMPQTRYRADIPSSIRRADSKTLLDNAIGGTNREHALNEMLFRSKDGVQVLSSAEHVRLLTPRALENFQSFGNVADSRVARAELARRAAGR